MAGERDRAAAPAGGLDLGALADRDRDAPGGESDLTGGDSDAARAPGNTPFGSGGPAGLDGGGIAVEAASYGPADGALADAAAAGDASAERPNGPTVGEAVGQGAGRGEPGSGTPGGRGETGGGGPGGAPGGTRPPGSARPRGGGGPGEGGGGPPPRRGAEPAPR